VVPVAVTRDISIQPVFGVLQLTGNRADVPVVYEGRAVSREVPFKMQLPPGKYEVRAVEAGKILSQQPIEVKPLSILQINVGQQP
jgi:hypothetical protein